MSNEQNWAQHNREYPDKYHGPEANYQMKTLDYVLRPSAGLAAFTITLPPVAEARGRWYSIVARNASNVNTITITDKNDSECWHDIILSAKCDFALLYSDGLMWLPGAGIREWPGQQTTNAPGTLGPTTYIIG